MIRGCVALAGLAVVAALLTGCGDGDDQGATTTSTNPTSSPSSAGSSSSTASTSSTTSASSTDNSSTSTSASNTVEVWFSSGDGSDCGEVIAVTREIASGADPLHAAFNALVAGPTTAEIAGGAGSHFSAETAGAVESTSLSSDGLLLIDFIKIQHLIPNASTSCGSMALRAQLDATAFQFEEVERVRYRIQGSCDEFGNFLQTECFDGDRSGNQLPVPTDERASGSGCTPPSDQDLPDGRWYGLVDTADDGELAFDLACWFSGTAAAAAAAEDGEESPPPNDYYVRNTNELLRTLVVTSAIEVTWYPDGGDPADQTTVDYDQWLIDREDRPFQLAVWLTIEDTVITAIDEQWVP